MEKNKKFDMDKHVVDTLNKYEDGPTIEQQVINYSPVKVQQKNKNFLPATPDEKKGIIKPNRNDDPSTYPKNQKEEMSLWDMMKIGLYKKKLK